METNLSWLDFTVLVLILLFPVLIGLFYGIKNKSISFGKITKSTNETNQVSEYLTASSSMSYLPIALSLLASFISTTSLLGTFKNT